MNYNILGFLAEKGWPGVGEVFLMIFIGAVIVLTLFTYFLVYRSFLKEEKTIRPTSKSLILKIILIGSFTYYISSI